ncbi:hypothetical protein NDU88_011003 [Pleurodeles waltl]|uniref:Uncharacterized protein n=1 Tax=Pleurodeles waltl TaxID=8319 RepID=A0AAV7QWA5_PLEWA|nr:hypothetical protein NDU88_011003 [Pleurodeles waltl]
MIFCNNPSRAAGRVLARHGISWPLRFTTAPQVKEVCLLWPPHPSRRRIRGSLGPKCSVLQPEGDPSGHVSYPTAHRDLSCNRGRGRQRRCGRISSVVLMTPGNGFRSRCAPPLDQG